jgi:hypothetical protein
MLFLPVKRVERRVICSKQFSFESASLGKLILNWNSTEHEIKEKLERACISGKLDACRI